jgi:hypothetical protein
MGGHVSGIITGLVGVGIGLSMGLGVAAWRRTQTQPAHQPPPMPSREGGTSTPQQLPPPSSAALAVEGSPAQAQPPAVGQVPNANEHTDTLAALDAALGTFAQRAGAGAGHGGNTGIVPPALRKPASRDVPRDLWAGAAEL